MTDVGSGTAAKLARRLWNRVEQVHAIGAARRDSTAIGGPATT